MHDARHARETFDYILSNFYGGDVTREEIEDITEALEKQIPKKPIMSEYCPAYCPACKEELSISKGDGYYEYYTDKKVCDCGQKLDWNRREEAE
jgi:hypothetical protein